MAYRPLILVLGCPRSGTSTVARILHTRLGVCMGHTFDVPTELNPDGYYEDKAMFEACDGLATGGITPLYWRHLMESQHLAQGCTSRRVGLKYPNLSLLSPRVINRLGASTIIATDRRPKAVLVKSFAKYAEARGFWGEKLTNIPEERRSTFIAEESSSFCDMYEDAVDGLARSLDRVNILRLGPNRLSDDEIIRTFGLWNVPHAIK